MLTATISDFRKDIRKYLDSVTNNSETLIVFHEALKGCNLSHLQGFCPFVTYNTRGIAPRCYLPPVGV